MKYETSNTCAYLNYAQGYRFIHKSDYENTSTQSSRDWNTQLETLVKEALVNFGESETSRLKFQLGNENRSIAMVYAKRFDHLFDSEARTGIMFAISIIVTLNGASTITNNDESKLLQYIFQNEADRFVSRLVIIKVVSENNKIDAYNDQIQQALTEFEISMKRLVNHLLYIKRFESSSNTQELDETEPKRSETYVDKRRPNELNDNTHSVVQQNHINSVIKELPVGADAVSNDSTTDAGAESAVQKNAQLAPKKKYALIYLYIEKLLVPSAIAVFMILSILYLLTRS